MSLNNVNLKSNQNSRIKTLKLSRNLVILSGICFLLSALINIYNFINQNDNMILNVAIIQLLAAICFFLSGILRHLKLKKMKKQTCL